VETHVRTLARGQAELGAEARVLCVNHRDKRGRDVTWQSFARTKAEQEWDGPVRLTRLGRRASLARLDVCPQLPRTLAGLRRSGVDLLHLHVPNPTMLLALAAVRPTLPLVVTYHSDVIRQRILGRALRPIEHLVFGKAAVLLSDSPTYPDGSALLRRYQDKLDVLPLGIDLGPYLRPGRAAREHAEQLEREHGKPLWLSVGRLVYYKGLHNAIRALPSVAGKLMIVGHGPLEGELKHLAEQLGVAGRVISRGRVNDEELIGAYLAATALWFPSNERSEGYGLVQVEAMASGCPVINSAIPHSGVPWVSRHEETGLTVPVNDPGAFAAAARRLFDEPGLRDRLAATAREHAAARFDQRLMAERSLTIYQRVLSRPSAQHVFSPLRPALQGAGA
jgi:rhamnosyl/mannosyltransferase